MSYSDAKYFFFYEAENEGYSVVRDLIENRKIITWWELEACLKLHNFNANTLPSLQFIGRDYIDTISDVYIQGPVKNLIPRSGYVISGYLERVLCRSGAVRFAELRADIWEQYDRNYWLDLELTHTTDAFYGHLTVLDHNMMKSKI